MIQNFLLAAGKQDFDPVNPVVLIAPLEAFDLQETASALALLPAERKVADDLVVLHPHPFGKSVQTADDRRFREMPVFRNRVPERVRLVIHRRGFPDCRSISVFPSMIGNLKLISGPVVRSQLPDHVGGRRTESDKGHRRPAGKRKHNTLRQSQEETQARRERQAKARSASRKARPAATRPQRGATQGGRKATKGRTASSKNRTERRPTAETQAYAARTRSPAKSPGTAPREQAAAWRTTSKRQAAKCH